MEGFNRRRAIALIAAAIPVVASAQEARITGRVTNESAVPIVGANVRIASMGLGSITGNDGRYSFLVPAARISESGPRSTRSREASWPGRV